MSDATRIAALEAEVATLTGTVRWLQEAHRERGSLLSALTIGLAFTWVTVGVIVVVVAAP